MQSTVQRRLAAILAADVVSYGRLMGADEMGTLEALKAHRRELIDPAIAAHHGRIVKTTGDGALVEFASVVDAVGCAVVIQRRMVNRNAGVEDDKRIIFRIGINVGDIIIDEDDIYGDGVNIAARLETLCEPGGLCISRAANDQIRDKLSLAFADLGEQAVKNITRAVGIFGLAAKEIEALPEPEIGQLVDQTPSAVPRRPELSALLGQVSVPTLVMHSREDARVPFDQGRRLAGGIPGARFVPLASRNHLILEDEPAFPRFLEEIATFVES